MQALHRAPIGLARQVEVWVNRPGACQADQRRRIAPET